MKKTKPELTSAVCTTETLKELKRLKRHYENEIDDDLNMYQVVAMVVTKELKSYPI